MRVDDREARALLGVARTRYGHFDGVCYPSLHPLTGQVRNYRVRRDHPEIEDGKLKHKYWSSIDRSTLYFPPDVTALLSDVAVPGYLVEAEKSALAIIASAARVGRRVVAIATRGCWNFRGRIGKTTDASGARVDETGELDDFDHVTWPARPGVILRDTCAATNLKVWDTEGE